MTPHDDRADERDGGPDHDAARAGLRPHGVSSPVGLPPSVPDRPRAARAAKPRLAHDARVVAGAGRARRRRRRRAPARGSRSRARRPSRARAGRPPRARARRRRCSPPRAATQSSSRARLPGRSGQAREQHQRGGRPRSRGGARSTRAGPRRRCRRRGSRPSCPDAAGAHLPAEQRGDADRAGALDDELGALHQHDHRLGGLVLADHHDVVGPAVEQPQRQLARPLDRDPVGDRQRRGWRAPARRAAATPGTARTPRPARRRPRPPAART